jgi:hypothetical protein
MSELCNNSCLSFVVLVELWGLLRMRTTRRQRRYVARRWLVLMRPVLRYSATRNAYVLRLVGQEMGPVLRMDRRLVRRSRSFDGVERRSARVA